MTNQEHNRDALIAHIQAQDTIIRNRNNTIVELREKLKVAMETPIPLTVSMEKKIAAAYKKGWKAAHKALLAEARSQWLAMSHLSEPPFERGQE